MKFEICLDSPQAAIDAQKYGADRVELCANLLEGGTTPSAGCILATRKAITIGLFVIIRPRGGDFYYNELEIEMMKANIQFCKKAGADGVVIGLLTEDGNIDIKNTKILMDLARPMEVTFHRAFDRCAKPLEAMNQLITLGIDRVLTSGQEQNAWEGRGLIQKMIAKAENKIIIMPGSGVNAENIKGLADVTQAKEFHFTARKKKKNDTSFEHKNFSVSEYERYVFDQSKLLSCIKNTQHLG